jgi:excinuclease ABC subunit B
MKFKLHAPFKPAGSQPEAIKKLVAGIKKGHTFQTLLGVTGSGKTYSMSQVIEQTQKPTIILAHNKTLASQLYSEFKAFFPENRVEYFVSYYDYYQPESYLPTKDQYIEKDAQINSTLERMRLAATASLSSRKDVIIIASVSAIYGLGNPKDYQGMGFEINKKYKMTRNELLEQLISVLYTRNDTELMPGRFRVKGDVIDFIPGYMTNIIRIELFGDTIERIAEIDKTNGTTIEALNYFFVYPARHFITTPEHMQTAIKSIRTELAQRLPELDDFAAHRLKQRTNYDLEMLQEIGMCKGIENYSRHLDGRKAGEKPYCLLDYFPKDFLIFIDESHQTLPQFRAMYNGDRSRKQTLVEYGFRLPSALDNRPLTFAEFEQKMKEEHVIFVSATPADYEIEHSAQIAEQIIRPTGLIDPPVIIKPITGQVDDLLREIRETIAKNNRVLVTTLTKKLAEELTDYLARAGVKTRYLHSDIETLERTEIIRELRLGKFDVLIGINLLREGLDIPEVGFIGILDADKEGFLRDARSLIQIIGRAARNSEAHVTLYADKMTDSIQKALKETQRRRHIQMQYNEEHDITPQTIVKPVKEKEVDITSTKHIPKSDLPNMIIELEQAMRLAADRLDFEEAIRLREEKKRLEKTL